MHPCEPQLGKRGLYPNMRGRESDEYVMELLNFVAYADGSNSLTDIAAKTDMSDRRCLEVLSLLRDAGVVSA